MLYTPVLLTFSMVCLQSKLIEQIFLFFASYISLEVRLNKKKTNVFVFNYSIRNVV